MNSCLARPNRFDWGQFKILLSMSIRMDFRSSRGMLGRWKKIPSIWGSFIFYALMGTSLAGGLLPDSTSFAYSILAIAYSMVMVAFAVILEYEQTILQPEDESIIGPLPVSPKTVLFAKFCNLIFYVILVGTSICLGPSLFGLALPGTSAVFPAVFFLMTMLANLFSAFFITVIYASLIRLFPPEKFRNTLIYLQIGLTFSLIFSYQLFPRAGNLFLQTGSVQIKGLLYCAPPAWFAGGVQYLSGSDISDYPVLFLIGILGVFFIAFLAMRQFSLSSFKSRPKLQSEEMLINPILKSRSTGLNRIEKLIGRMFHSPEMTAGFRLTLNFIKRDRSVKLGLYPVFGIPLAFIVLAILNGEMTDPFVSGPFTGERGTTSIVIFFIFFMVYFIISGLIYIRDWEAGWIFRVAPIVSPARFCQGVKLAVFFRFLLPFFVLLGIIYSIFIPWIHALRHTLSLFLLGLVASSIVTLFLKEYPFSKKREKGERMYRFGFLLFVLPFFGMMLAVQIFAYQNSHLLWMIQCGLGLMYIILESIAFRRLDKVLKWNFISNQ